MSEVVLPPCPTMTCDEECPCNDVSLGKPAYKWHIKLPFPHEDLCLQGLKVTDDEGLNPSERAQGQPSLNWHNCQSHVCQNQVSQTPGEATLSSPVREPTAERSAFRGSFHQGNIQVFGETAGKQCPANSLVAIECKLEYFTLV